jgi:hypothetical protein
MRSIRFFLVMTAASSLAAGFAIQACGGSSDTPATNSDAATESATPAKDAAVQDTSLPDVFDARPPCDPNKDILKDIPDASIADGASTTGICINCAQTKCKKEIDNCKKDCSRSMKDLGCQDLAAKALECYAKTQDAFMCGGDFLAAKQPTTGIGIALASCVQQNCQSECGVDGGM